MFSITQYFKQGRRANKENNYVAAGHIRYLVRVVRKSLVLRLFREMVAEGHPPGGAPDKSTQGARTLMEVAADDTAGTEAEEAYEIRKSMKLQRLGSDR